MSGYRADHVTWDSFPFKDPAQRMMKSGMGFNNIFNKSQQSMFEKLDGAQSQKLLNNYHSSKASISGASNINTNKGGPGDTSTNISSTMNLAIRNVSPDTYSGIGTKIRYQSNLRSSKHRSSANVGPLNY